MSQQVQQPAAGPPSTEPASSPSSAIPSVPEAPVAAAVAGAPPVEAAEPMPVPSLLAAQPSAPAPFVGFTLPATSSTKTPQKDASSVLGILQQAQANIASQRAGGARGMPPGATPAQVDGPIVSKIESATTALDVLHRKLEMAAALSSDARRALETDVLAMTPKLDSGRAADLVVRTHAAEAM